MIDIGSEYMSSISSLISVLILRSMSFSTLDGNPDANILLFSSPPVIDAEVEVVCTRVFGSAKSVPDSAISTVYSISVLKPKPGSIQESSNTTSSAFSSVKTKDCPSCELVKAGGSTFVFSFGPTLASSQEANANRPAIISVNRFNFFMILS